MFRKSAQLLLNLEGDIIIQMHHQQQNHYIRSRVFFLLICEPLLITMARKRTHEAIEQIDNVDGPIANTSIHGAITSLSPVKKGRNSIFFDDTLADETSKIRVVGFDAQQQRKLNNYHQKNIPVELINCEVKSSRYGEGYEVMLKGGTHIKESPKKMDVPALMVGMTITPRSITLGDLPQTENYEKVTVKIKVLEVKEAVHLADKLKQDVLIADHTATAKVSLWQEHVNTLSEHKCYSLKNFLVREYQSRKYLSMSKVATEVTPIDDIGVVVEQADTEDEVTIQNVTIIGVPHLDIYKACLQCKARVEPLTPPLGRCSRGDCQMLQRYDICGVNTAAKLLLMYESDGQKKIVQSHAYGELVSQIAGVHEVTPEVLLKATQFVSMTLVRDKKVIKEVKRC